MHNRQLKKIYSIIFLAIAVVVMVLTSCRRDDEPGIPPTIELRIDSGYVHSDDTVAAGKTFTVGIIAHKGDANITNFMMNIANDSLYTYLDTGLNAEDVIISKTIIKGLGQKDTWTFTVRAKDGAWASVSLNIFLDTSSTFGPVITIPSVILGAQHCTANGSFYDVKNNTIYFLADAFNVQDSIEMLYFYDAVTSDANTIASPNANIDTSVFNGTYGLPNWTVKNETRYLKTTLTAVDFDNFNNDSLLIATYNETLSKRKAKNLAVGDIYAFRTANNKLGLFEVLNVFGTDAGTVEIKIKMQPY